MHHPTVLKSQLSLTRCVTLSTCLATRNLSVLACEMGTGPSSAGCREEGGIRTTLGAVGTRSICSGPGFTCLCH